MSSTRFRYLLFAVFFMVTAPVTAAAVARTTRRSSPVRANAATLTLSVTATRSLARQHVTVRALHPAVRRKSSYALPTGSGKWHFATATGTLHLKGILAIVLGRRTVKISSVTFTRPARGSGRLTVTLAGHKVKLFTITGHARVKHAATSETVAGLSAKLTKPGATRLNRALRRHVFRAGQSLGSFTVTVSTSRSTARAPARPPPAGRVSPARRAQASASSSSRPSAPPWPAPGSRRSR
jgi:hypothetical protein